MIRVPDACKLSSPFRKVIDAVEVWTSFELSCVFGIEISLHGLALVSN